jgi:hypothetical protein
MKRPKKKNDKGKIKAKKKFKWNDDDELLVVGGEKTHKWLDDVYDILTGYLIFIVKKIQTIARRRRR